MKPTFLPIGTKLTLHGVRLQIVSRETAVADWITGGHHQVINATQNGENIAYTRYPNGSCTYASMDFYLKEGTDFEMPSAFRTRSTSARLRRLR